MRKKKPRFPLSPNIWDGEKFIRDPECEPYEEDLSLFDIESDEVREKKFLANLPKHYTDFLPVPKLSELINPDQREKHPELYNELEQECKDGIQYYSSNYDSYTKSLTLFLFFDDQDLWDKYNELTNGSLESHYKWNGEKFVKQ